MNWLPSNKIRVVDYTGNVSKNAYSGRAPLLPVDTPSGQSEAPVEFVPSSRIDVTLWFLAHATMWCFV